MACFAVLDGVADVGLFSGKRPRLTAETIRAGLCTDDTARELRAMLAEVEAKAGQEPQEEPWLEGGSLKLSCWTTTCRSVSLCWPAPEHDGWPRGSPRGQPASMPHSAHTKLSNDHRLTDAPVCLYCVPLWVIAIRSQTVPST